VTAGIVGMLLVAIVPVLVGWHSTVTISDSMAPGIRAGDVVVAPSTKQRVAPGAVVLVEDPAAPGRLLLHRLVDYDHQGRMILKGDANLGRDSTPVPVENLKGVASLRIPYVGLPLVWVREGRYLPVVAAVGLVLAVSMWRPRGHVQSPHRRPWPATSGRRAAPPGSHRQALRWAGRLPNGAGEAATVGTSDAESQENHR
jgi:signal peptidase